jgi:hypothetical protein
VFARARPAGTLGGGGRPGADRAIRARVRGQEFPRRAGRIKGSAARKVMTSVIRAQTFKVPRPSVPRKAVVFGLATSVAVIAVTVLRAEEWDAVVVLDVACILGLVWLIALTGNLLVYWASKRKLCLHVGPDGLCIERGAFRQLIPWKAITQVEIRSESGVAVGMDVYTAEGRELELQDFERLPDIVNLVKAGIPPTTPVKQL